MEEDWNDKFQLHFAAEDGDLARVKELVSSGSDVTIFDEIGYTPFHYAVKKEHFEVAKYFLDLGVDINIHDEEQIGETPLGAVAETCSYKMVKFLLENGANPLIPGWMQINALYRVKKRSEDDVEKEPIIELVERAAKKYAT